MTAWEIILAILAAVAVDELLGWSHRLAAWLVRRSARRAPTHMMERLEEEWLAHMEALPTRLSRILFAADCVRAAYVLSQRDRLPTSSPVVPLLIRAFDIATSALFLVVSLPLLVLFALAVRIESNGVVFARQACVGRDGRIFYRLRFRCNGAVNTESGRPVGLTRTGRFLRRTAFEELPQFINVLSGAMSFVGPATMRPDTCAKLVASDRRFADRFKVRPGLTGVAQIRDRAAILDPEQELAHDLYFVRHYSVCLTLKIWVLTIWTVLTRRL